ncbi:hypothetical protein D5086_031684 [Populus alba]|uniref:Uncharacterized protein n=1 Tax=Populus alba TaxID=43335 RepID=A0ACC4AJX9_POPAL
MASTTAWTIDFETFCTDTVLAALHVLAVTELAVDSHACYLAKKAKIDLLKQVCLQDLLEGNIQIYLQVPRTESSWSTAEGHRGLYKQIGSKKRKVNILKSLLGKAYEMYSTQQEQTGAKVLGSAFLGIAILDGNPLVVMLGQMGCNSSL